MTGKTIGQWGEERAAQMLAEKGFEILERNFHSRWGEIDIIAEDGEYLIFAEVKTRCSARFGTPAEAVTLSKQKKITQTAEVWLMEHPTEKQPRFDVIEVYASGMCCAEHIVHLTNAFEAIV